MQLNMKETCINHPKVDYYPQTTEVFYSTYAMHLRFFVTFIKE